MTMYRRMHGYSGSTVSGWTRLDWYKRQCSGWRRDKPGRNLTRWSMQRMV